MPRRTDSRDRMIRAAVKLFRRRGYHGTAFSDVVRESGAPHGSIHFHFPGGKEELLREVVAVAGDEIEEMVTRAASRADDAVSFVRILADTVAHRLEVSGYEDGCAIATAVLELAPRSEELSRDFADVFERWRTSLAAPLERWGFAHERAVADADIIMAVLEGALMLSRAARSLEPFRRATQSLVELIGMDMAATAATGPAHRGRVIAGRRS